MGSLGIAASHHHCVARVDAISEKLQSSTRLRPWMLNARCERIRVANEAVVGTCPEQSCQVVHVCIGSNKSDQGHCTLRMCKFDSAFRHLITIACHCLEHAAIEHGLELSATWPFLGC